MSKNLLTLLNEVLLKKTKGPLLLLVRKGYSLTNISGQLCGWIDVDLTPEGRDQAKNLMTVFFPKIVSIDGFYSSDLKRCVNFANIVLGFDTKKILKIEKNLRELNFGSHEGLHYDSLGKEEQEKIDNIHYAAPQGESWMEAQKRLLDFFQTLDNRKYLVFTHGGVLCSFTYFLGIQNVLKPGSVLAMDFNKDSPLSSEILFNWDYDQNNIIN
jgi:broad specificity phosphatase PhoE